MCDLERFLLIQSQTVFSIGHCLRYYPLLNYKLLIVLHHVYHMIQAEWLLLLREM